MANGVRLGFVYRVIERPHANAISRIRWCCSSKLCGVAPLSACCSHKYTHHTHTHAPIPLPSAMVWGSLRFAHRLSSQSTENEEYTSAFDLSPPAVSSLQPARIAWRSIYFIWLRR